MYVQCLLHIESLLYCYQFLSIAFSHKKLPNHQYLLAWSFPVAPSSLLPLLTVQMLVQRTVLQLGAFTKNPYIPLFFDHKIMFQGIFLYDMRCLSLIFLPIIPVAKYSCSLQKYHLTLFFYVLCLISYFSFCLSQQSITKPDSNEQLILSKSHSPITRHLLFIVFKFPNCVRVRTKSTHFAKCIDIADTTTF